MAHRILIVDDSPFVRRAVCASINRNSEWQVCGEAGNGQEAIAKARELAPDVIVLDLSMPVMNGLQAARILRRLFPTLPIIILSHYDDVLSEDEARSLGISALISKAEPISVLLNTAHDLLFRMAA